MPDDIWKKVLTIGAGVVLGALALSYYSRPKCPNCNTTIPGKSRVCPRCGERFLWK